MRNYCLFASFGLFALIGCGGGMQTGDGGADLAAADLTGGGGDLAQPPDLGVLLTGVRLVPGNLSLIGATSDGYAIYWDNDAGSVNAAKVSGGMPQKIADNACEAGTSGTVVFVWHDCMPDGSGGYIGALTLWTASSGAKAAATTSQADTFFADVAADSSLVAYLDNSDGTIADIIVDKPDHSAPKAVETAVTLDDSTCIPIFEFAADRLISVLCGANNAYAVSHDAMAVTIGLLDPAADFLVVDKKGGKVLVKDEMDVAQIFPAAGGMPLTTGLPDLLDGKFLPDGSAILYVTNGGGLFRAASTMGTAMRLQAVADGLTAISPDGKWALYHTMAGVNTDFSDFLLAPTGGVAMATKLSATATNASGGTFGDSFTADSGFALYFANASDADLIGTPTGASTGTGMGKAFGAKGVAAFAAGGSRVALVDNFTPVANEPGHGDLELVDVATATPTLLANSVDLDFNVTADKKTVVYTFSAEPSHAGLYAAPLP
jgi:hypothetical protein